jgi:hypothetical protein
MQPAQIWQNLTKNFNFSLGNFSVPILYWQVGAIVFLLFILVLMMAKFRRHYVDWSLKGAIFGIFFGFLLALLLEGFLIIGGKTALTELLGWKDAPAPVTLALDAGKRELIKVMGIDTQIPSSMAEENVGVQETVNILQSLNPADLKKVKSIICRP